MQAVEVARFRVRPENEEAFLGLRGGAIESIRSQCPGMLSAQLSQMDDGSWLDVVVWQSREQAENASAQAMSLPAFALWGAQIEEMISFEHSLLRHAV